MPRTNLSKLRLLRIAEEDLSEIIDFIESENPAAAADLLSMFEECFDSLARYPEIGKLPEDADLLVLGLRYLVAGRYLIFYKLDGDSVLVYRIFHHAQDYLAILTGEGNDPHERK